MGLGIGNCFNSLSRLRQAVEPGYFTVESGDSFLHIKTIDAVPRRSVLARRSSARSLRCTETVVSMVFLVSKRRSTPLAASQPPRCGQAELHVRSARRCAQCHQAAVT